MSPMSVLHIDTDYRLPAKILEELNSFPAWQNSLTCYPRKILLFDIF